MIEYQDLLGKGFCYEGRGPALYDCYGLAMEVCSRYGITLPERISPHHDADIHALMQQREELLTEIPEPIPGCMVFFTVRPPWVSHCGVMLDRYRFIHIMSNTLVTVERIDSLSWQRRVKGFYRVNDER